MSHSSIKQDLLSIGDYVHDMHFADDDMVTKQVETMFAVQRVIGFYEAVAGAVRKHAEASKDPVIRAHFGNF